MEDKVKISEAGQTQPEAGRSDGFWTRVLKGFVVGVAGMIPGASGGVLAVSMGIYRPALDAIYGFIGHMRQSAKYLLPLGIGGVAGLFATSRLVEWLLFNWKIYVMYALIGMVAGGVPDFMREANQFGFKKKYLFGTLLGCCFIAGLAGLENVLVGNAGWMLNGWTAMLAGGILAVGTVIPGVSTSFILMFMGLYEPLLSAFNRLNIPILACLGVGAAVIGALLILFAKRMFDRHHGYTYYTVLGFLAGTVVLIFPGIPKGMGTAALCLLLLAAGFAGSYFMARIGRRQK